MSAGALRDMISSAERRLCMRGRACARVHSMHALLPAQAQGALDPPPPPPLTPPPTDTLNKHTLLAWKLMTCISDTGRAQVLSMAAGSQWQPRTHSTRAVPMPW